MGMGGSIATSNLRYQQLLGWSRSKLPLQISIGRRGKWFTWTLKNETAAHPAAIPGPQTMHWVTLDQGEAPEPPSGLKRFWREPIPVWREGKPGLESDSFPIDGSPTVFTGTTFALETPSLSEHLLALDKLRAADMTPWDEVEKRANELLAKFTAPADKGRIHWQAAHVYGQSDIRGHGADVIRHAKEALKYERDPVQRGWLYMYLGDAAGLDAKSKDEATRWYLKGDFELLAFKLPQKAPELPTVGKFRGLVTGEAEGPNEDNQIVFEVLQAAEVKARKEAELVRDLVSRRDIHIQQRQNLWGRDYVEGSDAEKALKKTGDGNPARGRRGHETHSHRLAKVRSAPKTFLRH